MLWIACDGTDGGEVIDGNSWALSQASVDFEKAADVSSVCSAVKPNPFGLVHMEKGKGLRGIADLCVYVCTVRCDRFWFMAVSWGGPRVLIFSCLGCYMGVVFNVMRHGLCSEQDVIQSIISCLTFITVCLCVSFLNILWIKHLNMNIYNVREIRNVTNLSIPGYHRNSYLVG